MMEERTPIAWRPILVRGVITGVVSGVVWLLFDTSRSLTSAVIFGLVFGAFQIVWSIFTAPQARRQQRERQERREERERRRREAEEERTGE